MCKRIKLVAFFLVLLSVLIPAVPVLAESTDTTIESAMTDSSSVEDNSPITESSADENTSFKREDEVFSKEKNEDNKTMIGPQTAESRMPRATSPISTVSSLDIELRYPDGSPATNVPYSYTIIDDKKNQVDTKNGTTNSQGRFKIEYDVANYTLPSLYVLDVGILKIRHNNFFAFYPNPQDPTQTTQDWAGNNTWLTGGFIDQGEYQFHLGQFGREYGYGNQNVEQTSNGNIVSTRLNGPKPAGEDAWVTYYDWMATAARLVGRTTPHPTRGPYVLYYYGIGVMEKYVDTNGNLLPEVPATKKKENFVNLRSYPNAFGKRDLEKSFKGSSDQVWILDKVKHSKSHKYNDSSAVEITPDFDGNPQFTIDTDSDFEYLFYAYKKGFRVTEEFVPTENLNAKLEADKYHDMEENQKYEVTKKPADITYYGNVWEFDYWTLDGGTTKNYNMPVTINNVTKNETIKYVFKRSTKATGTMTLEPDKKTVSNNDTVNWTAKVNNTHTTNALKTMKLKADSSWSTGLKDPINVSITPDGGVTSNFTVNPGDWATGVDLTNIEIPAKKSAEIKFSTQATGTTNEVLSAKIKLSGNLANDLEAENVVRIDDEDEPNTNPSGDVGILNVPMFDFQSAVVKNTNGTYKLAEDDYQNQGPQPKNDPYVRFKTLDTSKTQWKLNAQLAQFQSTSSVETLSTFTTIALKDVQQAEVLNYNKPSESLSAYGSPFNLTIPSDSSPVPIANGTQNGVYQLKIPFESVEIQIPANQGVVGEKFHSVLTWSLDVTP